MSAPSGRPTRSRVSTPSLSTTKDSSRESADKTGTGKPKRGSQEGWQEPPIPQPKPSFADAGMERHGVVANMAPLGTYPSAKALKAVLKGDHLDGAGRTKRREASVASTPAGSLHAQTPEPTQTPEPIQTPEQSEPLESLELLQSAEPADVPQEVNGALRRSVRRSASASAKIEEFDGRATTPQELPVTSMDTRMSLPAQSPVAINGTHLSLNQRPVSEPYAGNPSLVTNNDGQGGSALQVTPTPTPYVIGNSLPPLPVPPALPLPLPPIGPDGEFMVDLALTERVLEYACQHALDDGKYPTAYALRTMYDDLKNHNPSVRMMEALYGGFATPGQRKEFLTQMENRKRGGKKDRTAEYYFNGDGSDLPIPPRRSSFFSSMGSMNNNMAVFTATVPTPYQTPYSPLVGSGPASATFASSDPAVRQSSLNLRSPSPDDYPTKVEESDEPPAKKQKITDFFGSRFEMNGTVGKIDPTLPETSEEALETTNGTSKSPNQRASRSVSVSSSSSALSSVNEDLLNAPNSAFNSPAKPTRHESPVPSPPAPSLPPTRDGVNPLLKNSLYASLFFQQPAKPFVSPYSSKENFISVAAKKIEGTPEVLLATPPITTQPKPKGPKKYTFNVIPKASAAPAPPPSSASNNQPNAEKVQSPSPAANNKPSMAPAVIESSSSTTTTSTSTTAPVVNPPSKSNLNTRTNRLNKEKAAKAQTPTPPEPYDPNDTPNRLKRQARERTNRKPDQDESNERHQVIPHLPEPEVDSDADSVAVNVNHKRPKKTLKIRAPTTRARRNHDDSDENQSSPTVLSFHADIAPGSLSASRAGTPNIFNRPTRKGKTGTGLRVKTSPMKKKSGTLAGLPRASGERNSPSGGANGPGENDDYCSSCGGNGGLVCCDGCDRSFHYQCVDPPMIEGALPDDAWFCNLCQSLRQPPHPEEGQGTFGPLLFNLDRKNPQSFHLPEAVRERFEGVRTGTEGEYEEIVPPKPKGSRPGWEEAPDYFRTKDSKGNLIICYHCHTTASAPDRKVIPCSFCPNYWHLDCVPNPLAKEPGAGRQWKCPLHVDDLLLQLPAQLAPAHRFRKVKGSTAVRPAVSRGIRNNGHIEVDNAPSDDEELAVFQEQREYDKVYKLPEQGLKLDFISKVRRDGGGNMSRLLSRERSTQKYNWNQQGIEEQQAALNLAALAHEVPAAGNTDSLINALIKQAPPAVISLFAQGSAPALSFGSTSDNERQTLLALKAVIDSRLSALNHNSVTTNDTTSKLNPSSALKVDLNGDDTEMSL